MKAFIGNYQMIRKVYLPRIVLVAASATSSLIGLLLNLLVFFIFAFFEGVQFTWKVLYFIPLLVALYFIVLGVSLILSIVVVRIRDMQNLWEVLTTLGFWLSPVMYPMSKIPEEWRFYMFINPISGLLEYSRYFLVGIGGVTHAGYFYVLSTSVIILAAGIYYFEKKNPEMTEEL
jgi:ABC-type polysaccharide/polyol phosphate export permease